MAHLIYNKGGILIEGQVARYRNADYFESAEKCDSVVIVGDYPHIVKAYEDAGIEIKLLTNESDSDVNPSDEIEYDKITADEIKAMLDEKGIEHNSSASKKELFELLTNESDS